MEDNNLNQNSSQNINQDIDPNIDELQELLETLDKKSALARPEFENGLYHAYISQAGKGRGPIQGVWKLMTTTWTVAGAFAIALVVFAALFIVRNMQPTGQTNTLTPQTKDVLRQVMANNPQVVLNLQNAANPGSVAAIPIITQPSTTTTASQTTTSAAVNYQKVKSFNYSYTRNLIDFGAAKQRCTTLNRGVEGAFETYHYYDGEDSYIKSLVYSAEEDLQDYYLQVPEYYIHYKEGDFAAKVALDEGDATSSTTRSADTTSSIDNSETEKLAVDFFGDDVEVKEQKDETGKEYYEIVVKREIDCGQAAETSTTSSQTSSQTSSKATSSQVKQNMQTIISVSKVDAETYEMFAQSEYIDEVTTRNLIQTMEIEQDTRSVTFADIEKIFTFDYEAPLEAYEKGAASEVTTGQVMDAIADHNIPVIWPDNGEASIRSVYIPETWKTETYGNEYLLERSFYPKGVAGDTAYEAAVAAELAYLQKTVLDSYKLVINFHWGEEDTRALSISMFTSDTKLGDLADEILKSDAMEELDPEVLSFTESRVNARVLAPKEEGDDSQKIYLFTWGDINYMAIFDPITNFTDTQAADALEFEVLNAQNKLDEAKLLPEITSALEDWYEQN